MKKNSKGFVLVETLIVTSVVSGILLYLFIQLTNLTSKYDDSHKYNNIQDLHLLVKVIDLINNDDSIYTYFDDHINDSDFVTIDVSNCTNFSNINKCKSLMEKINIEELYVTLNDVSGYNFSSITDDKLKDFIGRISKSGVEKYRLIAKFEGGTYATVKFGDGYE